MARKKKSGNKNKALTVIVLITAILNLVEALIGLIKCLPFCRLYHGRSRAHNAHPGGVGAREIGEQHEMHKVDSLRYPERQAHDHSDGHSRRA